MTTETVEPTHKAQEESAQDAVKAAFRDGQIGMRDFARLGREAGLAVCEVASALRARLAGEPASAPERPRLGLRVVMVSGTHGGHRKVECPPGDVLIHAGDFTRYGKLEDAQDFNAWLAELPHAHKFVVLGNHEANAPWRKDVAAIVSNATLLCGEGATVRAPAEAGDARAASNGDGAAPAAAEAGGEARAASNGDVDAPAAALMSPAPRALSVFGTDFFWPMKTPNPHYGEIPVGVDVLVVHGPAAGYVDGGAGCDELLRHCKRVRPRLVVSGHIHGAHGVADGKGALKGTTFVNAANALRGHGHMGWPAVVLDL